MAVIPLFVLNEEFLRIAIVRFAKSFEFLDHMIMNLSKDLIG